MEFGIKKTAAAAGVIAIALIIGGFIPFSDYYQETGTAIYSRSHNLFFDFTSIKYPALVKVKNPSENISIGFDTGTDKISFGIAIAGGSVNRKFINVTNEAYLKARVTLRSSGNISSMISYSENSFILEPGERKEITLSLAPGSSEEGNYEGYVEVEFRKARFPIFEGFV